MKMIAAVLVTLLLVAGCSDAKKPDHDLPVKHPSGSRSPM